MHEIKTGLICIALEYTSLRIAGNLEYFRVVALDFLLPDWGKRITRRTLLYVRLHSCNYCLRVCF